MAAILASTRRPSPAASARGQLRASCSGYAHTGEKFEPTHQAPQAEGDDSDRLQKRGPGCGGVLGAACRRSGWSPTAHLISTI
eukprot:SAG31_NODE_778_length_12161_cov_101.601807_7_plen_83_part_00